MGTQQRFHSLVNMSPSAIRKWANDPRARCASFQATRDRLPALAKLKAKPRSRWTRADYAYAKRVISFNARFLGMVKQHGCTTKMTVALMNWGHKPKSCKLSKTCSSKGPG
jgi:hypothetical protein